MLSKPLNPSRAVFFSLPPRLVKGWQTCTVDQFDNRADMQFARGLEDQLPWSINPWRWRCEAEEHSGKREVVMSSTYHAYWFKGVDPTGKVGISFWSAHFSGFLRPPRSLISSRLLIWWGFPKSSKYRIVWYSTSELDAKSPKHFVYVQSRPRKAQQSLGYVSSWFGLQ
jgi:hypothetical protein